MSDSNKQEKELVRLAEFFNSIDANMFKGVLESNGIFSILDGEHSADLGITIPGVGSHVYVQVQEDDYDEALELLKEGQIQHKVVDK